MNSIHFIGLILYLPYLYSAIWVELDRLTVIMATACQLPRDLECRPELDQCREGPEDITIDCIPLARPEQTIFHPRSLLSETTSTLMPCYGFILTPSESGFPGASFPGSSNSVNDSADDSPPLRRRFTGGRKSTSSLRKRNRKVDKAVRITLGTDGRYIIRVPEYSYQNAPMYDAVLSGTKDLPYPITAKIWNNMVVSEEWLSFRTSLLI